ncbi:MAG: ABC transporter ATP-binding protein [Alphaproteobacteria bacterium]|nr:ABC transporter ATP-binding protein [Alphaproteobacteria bacterium]MDA8000934.1 ABC transporter ATP-binding protein [Alphaproteobacteria bacterium]MDA8004023.1 ABC transporter ATP-binding protein [Alphaproteobacteria bacterium]MDA8005768.1 ABC transporter ATP-binding protein [Alphaproteobacteria bacterium]MDA8008704.1 ABC transporter ATP-binding protein [Alphaproteobacteria bacterium]
MTAAASLSGVYKSFGAVEVLTDITLEIDEGEFVVFVGPSGCGKSTLLCVIAGLEDATSGEIRIGGEVVNSVPPSRRGVAMVFQSYALYPHLSVRGNMSLALKQERQPKGVIASRVAEASRMLNLGEYLDRYPSELSGGQRQRVAIGRAIVRKPRLFLFDEPLSNLDAALRMNTRLEIANLHRQLETAMIYVTHDQTEAMTLADKIVVLREGRVEQVGTPMELYNDPVNRFVAGFLGSPAMNFLPAGLLSEGDPRVLGVRPEDFFLSDDGHLRGVVEHIEHLGGDTNVILTVSGHTVTLRLFGQHEVPPAGEVCLSFDPARAYYFGEGGERI